MYIEQSLGFVNPTHPDFILKLDKALYGLKQALRIWYERVSSFLVLNNFVKCKVDTTLFIKHVDNDILIMQIYVDNIIFGSTNEKLCKDFESCMKEELKWVWCGSSTIFLDSESSKRVSQVWKRAYQEIWVRTCED